MFLNFGMATAMAWIMGAILVGFTLRQLQILNKLTFRSTAVEAEANGGAA
jgi:ABC-type sugar transport system permease subunit